MPLTNLLSAAVISLTAMSTAASDSEPLRMEPPVLEPCPETPNCVSTQAEREEQRMDPIPYGGDLEGARARLLAVLEAEPRVSVEEVQERLVRAVFTTRILRFKDDVVFLFDPDELVIHFRSASRVGRSDMGANRDRMERMTELYLKAEAAEEPTR